MAEGEDITRPEPENEFRSELKHLINRYSMEQTSNSPDHVLADYLIRCLDNFAETTHNRESWYGVNLKPGQPMRNEVGSPSLRSTDETEYLLRDSENAKHLSDSMEQAKSGEYQERSLDDDSGDKSTMESSGT